MDDLSVEWNSHGAEEKSSVLIRLGSSVEGNMATRDHLGGVPV